MGYCDSWQSSDTTWTHALPQPVLVVFVGFGVPSFRTSLFFPRHISCMFRSIRIGSPATCLSNFVVLIVQCVVDQKLEYDWPYQQCSRGGATCNRTHFRRMADNEVSDKDTGESASESFSCSEESEYEGPSTHAQTQRISLGSLLSSEPRETTHADHVVPQGHGKRKFSERGATCRGGANEGMSAEGMGVRWFKAETQSRLLC